MRQYRPVTIAVGILFVLLGGLTRLAEPEHVFEETTRVITKGTIGQDLRYGDSSVKVTRMVFATSFLADEDTEKAVTTDGIFVAVEYDATRGQADPRSNEVQLTADGGTIYRPVSELISSDINFPEPGFAKTGAYVFEVNPADLEGLTFRVETRMFFTVLGQNLAVDLGVPSEEIGQRLVDEAKPEYLVPETTLRVASS